MFAGITGIVNYERWGDPFTFADLHIYEVWANGFVKVVDEYGACNLVRIPFGILYYFVPIWAILRDDGAFVLSGNPPGVVPNMELPPSSFFLTDPLVLGLAVTFFFVAARRGSRAVLDVPVSYALLAGLAVPMFLILTAIVMTFRYRMEFYPFFDAAAFLCLLALARSGAFARGRCWQVAMAGAALCGMISSHLMLLFYKIASGGWAGAVVMPDGWGAFLRRLMEQHYPSIQHVLDRLLS